MQLVDRVTPLVEAWEPACVETSQYIKSHETAPTLQISYCVVEHIKKKKTEEEKFVRLSEKSHMYWGQLPLPLYSSGYCDKPRLITSLGWTEVYI